MLEVCFFQHTPTFIIEPKKVTYRGDPGDESLGSPFLQACFIAAAGMVTFENAYIFCESVKRTA